MSDLELPRDNLTRTVGFTPSRADDDENDGLTLRGYGAVFGQRTRIDSWEGLFDEEIARGAFAKTLKERTPVVQFDHGHHGLVGSIPIAAPPTISEDDHGLYLHTRLHDNWLVQPVRDAIASGSIDGMSFRFRVVKEKLDESGDIPLRTITEVELYEVGPVVFPAYTGTSVGVRSREIADLLADPDARAELARALVLGTPDPEAASDGTSDGAATPDQEPPAHSGLSPDARSRALELLTPKEGKP